MAQNVSNLPQIAQFIAKAETQRGLEARAFQHHHVTCEPYISKQETKLWGMTWQKETSQG